MNEMFFAVEEMLKADSDRIQKLDRRRLPTYLRRGLVHVIPDGTYMPSVKAVEDVKAFMELTLKTETHMGPGRKEELQGLVQKADRWLSTHRSLKADRSRRFDALSSKQYFALWQLGTTDRCAYISDRHDVELFQAMIGKGCVDLVKSSPSGIFVKVNQQGLDLIVKHGDPRT